MATPEQVDWATRKTVPEANKLLEVYYEARATVNEWFAENMGGIIPNDSTVVLHSDGGHDLTGAEVTNFVTRQIELLADYEADNNAKLNTLIQAASGRPRS